MTYHHPTFKISFFLFLFRTTNTAQGKQSSQSSFSLGKYFPLIRLVAIKWWRVIHEPSHFEPESVKKDWKKDSTARAEQRGIWVLCLFCAVRRDYRSGYQWLEVGAHPSSHFLTCLLSTSLLGRYREFIWILLQR